MKINFESEKKIMKYLRDNYLIIGIVIISFLALWLRICELNFESGDYVIFLSPWFDYLKSHGGLRALATYKGDYNAPYVTILALLTYLPFNKLHLIKMVSIIFDYSLAISSACLVHYLVPKNKKEYSALTYAVILFLPEVFLNSALWAQCDAGYTTFIVLALLFLLKEKYLKSFIFLGIAFSLKLQFIFILPIFIVLYVSKTKFPMLYFFIIPLVNFILCIPAIIFGRPISKIITVYFNQTKTYKNYLSLNISNLYSVIDGPTKIFYGVAIILTIAACTLMLGYVIYKKVKWNNEKILNLALWFIVVVTFLLPGMHDRYLYVGEILSVILYIVYKKNLPLTICLIVNALIIYSIYLFRINDFNLSYLTIIYLVIIVYFTKNTINILSE